MIRKPSKPSRKTPHVEVAAGNACLKFWMNPGAKPTRNELIGTLGRLPEAYTWRATAQGLYRSLGNTKSVDLPSGAHFHLQAGAKGGCTDDQFNTAFKTFHKEILKAAQG